MKKYIFIIILLFAISLMLYAANAQVQLETGLPNIPNNQIPAGQELPSYINYLFIFGLSAIAFLALAQMMIGGLTYILAAGNVAKVEDAKDIIKQALIGLGLLLVSYLLLRTINPDLVNLRSPNLTPINLQIQQPAETTSITVETTTEGGKTKTTIESYSGAITCLGAGWLGQVSCGGATYQNCKNNCQKQINDCTLGGSYATACTLKQTVLYK